MNLQQFEQLASDKRLKTVVGGVCIASPREPGYRVLLFQLDGFYIEVFSNEGYDFISHPSAFEEIDRLTPYLEKMNISL